MPQLIFNLFFCLGITFGIIFICYTYFYKKRRSATANKLTLFLLTFTFNNIQIILVDNFSSIDNCFIHNLHPFLFFVFVVPHFHSFITHYLKIEKVAFNYLPIANIIFSVGMVARIILSPFFNIGNCNLIGQYAQLEEIVIIILSLVVFIHVIRIIYFKKELFEELLTYDKLKWINQFIILGGIVLVFWIFAIIFNFENYVNEKFYSYYPLRISSAILLYWVGYKASFRNVLTLEREQIRQKLTSLKQTISVTTNPKNELSQKFKEICEYFDATECYLNPDLTLDNLSAKTKINRSNLSSEINTNRNQNFNDFVNSYRVEKAKILIKDSDYDNYTVDAIGLECGFNSKSTFYSAFKKFTNTTPAAYKQIIL